MGLIRKLAARWANPKLFKEASELRFRLVNANAGIERLSRKLNGLQDSLNKSLATNEQWEVAYEELEKRRDEALALKEAEKQILADRLRTAEASLSRVREQLRQSQKARELAEQDAADKAVTVEGLGFAMRDMEQAAAERRVILPGQRADLHDIDDEKRYHDGFGDE